MTDNLKAFYRQLSADGEIKREFRELLDRLRASQIESIIGFAETHGVTLVAEDFVVERKGDEISEEELGVVTGGYGRYGEDCGLPVAVEDPYNYLWS